MKRMVENSEKIEELADAVENSKTTLTFKKQVNFDENVNVQGVLRAHNGLEVNRDLVTSNITTIDGTKIDIINENMYGFYGNAIPTSVYNLGTALIISGVIPANQPDGTYDWMYIDLPNEESRVDLMRISNGREVDFQIINEPNYRSKINIVFNSAHAVHRYPDYYEFVAIVGTYVREI